MKIAVCPGSFDPITMGHLDIITRASALFDRVIVLISINVAHLPNVEVDSFDGLLVEYVRARQATVIVRGLRAMSDFEYEFQMALANKRLNPEAETMFLTMTAENMYLSSSLVKQIAGFGGNISGLVPACIQPEIEARLANPSR